jgi:hypothetical protein
MLLQCAKLHNRGNFACYEIFFGIFAATFGQNSYFWPPVFPVKKYLCVTDFELFERKFGHLATVDSDRMILKYAI